MAAFSILCVVLASLLFGVNCASHPGSNVAIRTHNAPGVSDKDTHLAMRQAITSIRKRGDQDDVWKGNVTLQRSWDNAVLLFLSDKPDENYDGNSSIDPEVEIVCTKCYVNALATAELKFGPNYNISEALEDIRDEAGDVVANISKAGVDWVRKFTHDTVEDILSLDFEDVTFPPFNVTLDVDLESDPDVKLEFSFQEFELFMQVRTMLANSSSLTIPLYEPSFPMTFGAVELGLGFYFTVDLILDVERPLDMTSGIHLKLDDGVSFSIDLFGDKPSDIAVNGGQFEFLPVTVGADGAIFSAILRVGAHAGLEFDVFGWGAGLEVAVFADVAEIVTNITATPDDANCKLSMSQEYSIALGAVAGATVVVDDATYGPVAETSTPVWYTTVTGLCASEVEITLTASPTTTSQTLARRDDLETTVLSTKIIQTGVFCPQSLGPNCPNSLRSTTQYTETRTLTTAVPSGEDATFPTTVHDIISAVEAFGSNALTLMSSSGSPTSYIEPPPTSTSSSKSDENGDEKKGSAARGATVNVAFPITSGLLVLVAMAAFTL